MSGGAECGWVRELCWEPAQVDGVADVAQDSLEVQAEGEASSSSGVARMSLGACPTGSNMCLK